MLVIQNATFTPPLRRALSQLISGNADYLVNSVALQLRGGLAQHPEALQVMRAVLTHGYETKPAVS